MPAVIRVAVGQGFVTLMFEDGTGTSYRNPSTSPAEIILNAQDGHRVGQLAASFPETDTLVLEGPVDGQTVRMTLRRIVAEKKDYLLRNRGFPSGIRHSIVEASFASRCL